MRRRISGVLLGTGAIALALAGGGGVAAAADGSTTQVPCSVVLSTADGPVTASGKGVTGSNGLMTCHGVLPDGSALDADVITGETCQVVISASSRVNAICH